MIRQGIDSNMSPHDTMATSVKEIATSPLFESILVCPPFGSGVSYLQEPP